MQILLVEDNEIDIKITLRFLHRAYRDLDVLVAKNGQEALQVLYQQIEESSQDGALLPDLIILDIIMPVLDGKSFIQVKNNDKELKKIPVIVFTSKDREGRIKEIDGVQGHVAKELGGEDLIREINKVLHL